MDFHTPEQLLAFLRAAETAARAGKRALCLCTISDHMYRTEELTPEERERTMNDMIEIALDTAAAME